ncbi:hypothetical protein E2C01_031584 [Portunus trituberculatus]|uniref:Transposase Tc1-like domain-containing protein n=1 Tax=Portunus trituberculatus TaxID=210409 RepID=A0A5B7EYY8_PORTR|nr:hypothetical protein [Portunus trituberculatus]
MAVIIFYKANHPVKEVAKQTSVSVCVCQKLVKWFKEERGEGIPAPRSQSGRPKLISPTTIKLIGRKVKAYPCLTAAEIKENNPQLLSRLSLRCVQQCLHDDLNLGSFRARKKPLLTAVQKKKRVAFAKK